MGACVEALVPCVPAAPCVFAVLCVAVVAAVPELVAADAAVVADVAAVVGCVLCVLLVLFAFSIKSTEHIMAQQTTKDKIIGKNFFIAISFFAVILFTLIKT